MRLRIDWWLVAVLILPVLYFLPEVLGNNVFAGIDSSRLNMPLRYFDREAFASGAFPLWNPYMFAGFPGFAESESGVLYPGSIFGHLPGDFFHWYSIGVVAHLMVAGLGFYVWMRRRGNSQPISAFLAATYCTTPFLIFHITAFGLFTSIAWLPWYLVIFDVGMKGKHPVMTGFWLSLFLAVMLLSGSSHAALLGAMALIFYAIGLILAQPDRTSRIRTIIRSLAVLVPCLLCPFLAAIQILPTAELASLSERTMFTGTEYFELGTWLTVPRLASIVIFPMLGNPVDLQDYGSSLCFLGVIPFVLVVSTIARYRTIGRSIFPLLLGATISLILAFGMNLPGYTYLVEIPPFSLFRYPGRSAHIAFTFLLPLAGPAIEIIRRSIVDKTRTTGTQWWTGYIVGLVPVVVVVIIGLTKSGMILMGSMLAGLMVLIAILLGTAIFTGRILNRAIDPKRIGLATALIVSLVAQCLVLYPFSRILVQEREKFDQSLAFLDDVREGFPVETEIPRIVMAGGHELMDPETLSNLGFRAQENIYDNIAGNAPGLRGVTAVDGLTPLVQDNWKYVLRDTLSVQMGEAAKNSMETGTPKIPDALSLQIIRLLGSDVLLIDGSDWRIPGWVFWRDDLDLPYHPGLAAYRPAGVYAEDAYFVRQVDVVGQQEFADFRRWLGQAGRNVEREAVVVGNSEEIPGNLSMGGVVSRERGINQLAFDVQVPGESPAFLVTGENFYPGWKAFVDGNEVPYYRTNYLMGGVVVPSGAERVELRFEPETFAKGLKISIFSFVVWIVLLGIAFAVHKSGRASLIPPTEEDLQVGMEG